MGLLAWTFEMFQSVNLVADACPGIMSFLFFSSSGLLTLACSRESHINDALLCSQRTFVTLSMLLCLPPPGLSPRMRTLGAAVWPLTTPASTWLWVALMHAFMGRSRCEMRVGCWTSSRHFVRLVIVMRILFKDWVWFTGARLSTAPNGAACHDAHTLSCALTC